MENYVDGYARYVSWILVGLSIQPLIVHKSGSALREGVGNRRKRFDSGRTSSPAQEIRNPCPWLRAPDW